MDAKELIARRVAQEFKDGDIVNLGIGIPTLSTAYLPEGVNVILHSENGHYGFGPAPSEDDIDYEMINASGQYCTLNPGAVLFNSAVSFGIIRGGHLDATVLGALQVDEEGNIANWKIPGKKVPGIGGAMDLVVGAKRVIVAMGHTSRGQKKILKKCTIPITGVKEVDLIITDKAVFDVTNSGLILKETAPGVTIEELRQITEADFAVDENIKVMNV